MAVQKTQRVTIVFDDLPAMLKMQDSALSKAGHYERLAAKEREKARRLQLSIDAVRAGRPLVSQVDLPV